MTPLELEDRVALVTGASRGLGKAIALKLASMGAKVAVNFLSHQGEAEKVTSSITQKGGQAMPAQADVPSCIANQQIWPTYSSRRKFLESDTTAVNLAPNGQ